MPAKPFILFPPDSPDAPWRAGTSGPILAEGVDARAALDALGYAGQPVLLAVPSRWCLAAMISTADLPRKDRRRAMLYRLEEKLPLAAEEVVADFITTYDERPTPEVFHLAFGVCCAVETLRPVIDALEADGIPVRHACPAALLAGRRTSELNDGDFAAVWQSPNGVDLLMQHDALLRRWVSLPPDAGAILMHLRLFKAELGKGIFLYLKGLEPGLAARLQAAEFELAGSPEEDRAEFDPTPIEEGSATESALVEAAAILNGRPAWVDFRRDALAAPDAYDRLRPPLTAALLAAGLALATLCGVTLWRARANDHFADRYEAAEQQVFAEIFPKVPMPPAAAVRRRLEIERRRVAGSPQVGDTAGAAAGASALVLLNDALSRLPAAVRYRLVELRVSPGELFLDGQARTHGDAGALADALRGMKYYEIAPPGTEQLPATKGEGPAVAFRINGTHAAPKASGSLAKGVSP